MAFLHAHDGMAALMHDRLEDGDRIVGIAADDQLRNVVGRRAAFVILAADAGLLAAVRRKAEIAADRRRQRFANGLEIRPQRIDSRAQPGFGRIEFVPEF